MKNFYEILPWLFAIIAAYFILKPSKEERELGQLAGLGKKGSKDPVKLAFDKQYFAKVSKNKGVKPTELLKSYGYDAARLRDSAKAIYDAKGLIDDDEDVVYAVFASVPNLFVASAITFTFNYFYKKDLLTYLQGFLDVKELNKLFQIINTKKSL